MSMHKKKQLDRILRVRTLQLGMTRAEEARAQAKMANEADLAQRIARLADSVAPAPTEAGSGFSLVRKVPAMAINSGSSDCANTRACTLPLAPAITRPRSAP